MLVKFGITFGGIKEIITEDVGLLIDPNDPSDLANAIDRILSDEELMERFKSNARDIQYCEATI